MSLLIDLQGRGYNLFEPCWRRSSGREVLVSIRGIDDVDWLRRCRSCNGLGGAFRSREASSCALSSPTLAVTWASEAKVA